MTNNYLQNHNFSSHHQAFVYHLFQCLYINTIQGIVDEIIFWSVTIIIYIISIVSNLKKFFIHNLGMLLLFIKVFITFLEKLPFIKIIKLFVLINSYLPRDAIIVLFIPRLIVKVFVLFFILSKGECYI